MVGGYGRAGLGGHRARCDSGLLFVGNEQGLLHAIDRDGKVRWKFETGKPIRAQPKVIGEHVYVASDSGLPIQARPQTRREVWRARIDSGSEPRIPTNHEKTRWDRYGSSVVSDGKRLYIASRDKNLYALDIKNGRELWRVTADDIMTATPALHGDLVIFADYAARCARCRRAMAPRAGPTTRSSAFPAISWCPAIAFWSAAAATI